MPAWMTHITVDDWASIATAVFTGILALLTGWLARSTIREGRRSTGLQLFSQMVDSYQSAAMRNLRSRLARSLEHNFSYSMQGTMPPMGWVPFDANDLTVWEFFENMGRLVRAKALDRQITWNYFSDAAVAYWEASSLTILTERKRSGDQDLFTDFQWLAMAFAARNSRGRRARKLRQSHSQRTREFLLSEMRLSPLNSSSLTSL